MPQVQRSQLLPRGRRPSTAPIEDAGTLKRQMPFWEDLYGVTEVVAPWSLFSLMINTPEVPLKLPVPTTFMFVPDEKLVARISTGVDGKLCVRNDSKETPVTFEMMETNLIDTFNARLTDRQPYICTIYSATDYRPRFVSKANFTLFTLYLRASLGQNISSYGREEQEQAAELFPPKVACVQAYIPVEMDKRFISVYLKSSIRTLVEVHQVPYYPEAKIKFFVHEPPAGDDEKLSLLKGTDPNLKYIVKRTAGVVMCLRNYHSLRVPGLVCEFVQGIDGNLFLTSVLRVAGPVKHHFPSELIDQGRVAAGGTKGRGTVDKIVASLALRKQAMSGMASPLNRTLGETPRHATPKGAMARGVATPRAVVASPRARASPKGRAERDVGEAGSAQGSGQEQQQHGQGGSGGTSEAMGESIMRTPSGARFEAMIGAAMGVIDVDSPMGTPMGGLAPGGERNHLALTGARGTVQRVSVGGEVGAQGGRGASRRESRAESEDAGGSAQQSQLAVVEKAEKLHGQVKTPQQCDPVILSCVTARGPRTCRARCAPLEPFK